MAVAVAVAQISQARLGMIAETRHLKLPSLLPSPPTEMKPVRLPR